MIVTIICAAVINVVVYTITLVMWRKDCRVIGKDDLAVSLRDRLFAIFLCFTLPSILGLLRSVWRR